MSYSFFCRSRGRNFNLLPLAKFAGIFLLILLAQFKVAVGAEQAILKGTVTDESDAPQLKNVEPGDIVVFSFIGMTSQEILFSGQPSINVKLLADTQEMEEVVVTALGIKREKKALGYSAQDVKSDDIVTTGDADVASALSGKIAGVQISDVAGGAGSNSRIEIRGTSSLTGDDGPLWVVDGVPFDNSNSSDGDLWGGTSRAGGSFDLNPEDIETISVLKGPNAAALYGERGGNGVIMVTTKKGVRNKGLGISYSGNVTISKAAYFLDMQNKYGQGSDGVYDMNGTDSWGPLMEGQMLEAWTGETIAYEAQDDRIEDFTRTGISQNHNIAVTGGNDDGRFRASVGKNITQGIYEDNKVEKLTFDLKADYNINNWLNIDTKISYFRTEGSERPEAGYYGALFYYYNMPMNIRNQDLKPGYEIVDGEHVESLYTTASASYRNPYFLLASRTNEDQKDRLFGHISANLKLAKGLTAKLKYGLDTYRFGREWGTLYADNVTSTNPTYNSSEKYFKEENYEYLISYTKDFNDDWSFNVNFGGSKMNQYYKTLSASSGELASEGDFFLANGTDISASESLTEWETRSIYGFANIAYKNMLFLDITGRNDWSSTLTSSSGDYDNSYFYPSVGLSGIVSEMVALPDWISFAKIRTSVAMLGKSADPYQTSTDYTVSTGKFDLLSSEVPDEQVIQDLKPEMSTSYESGLDIRFFNGRLSLDATYYYERTKNQILDVEVAYSSGYSSKVVNAGLITNKGLEVLLKTIPIKTKDFQLGVDFNVASNTGKMVELTDDLTEYEFSSFNGGTEVMGIVGEKLGVIRGSKYVRDDNGDIIIGADGLPTYEELQVLGNVQPDLTGSIGFNANYKGIYLSTLFSGQLGGDIVSVTEAEATSSGNTLRTLANNREDFYADGVLADGSANTTPVSAQEYWGTVSNIDEEFVYDATYLKLKEVALGYSIPKTLLEKLPGDAISSVKFSLVGRNLFYLYKDTPGTVPDAAYSSSYFAKAFDFSTMPATRTFGFSLNVKF